VAEHELIAAEQIKAQLSNNEKECV
jgi:hypothetical protein